MSKFKLLSLNCFVTKNSIKLKGLIHRHNDDMIKKAKGDSPLSSLFNFASSPIKIKIELIDEDGKMAHAFETYTDRFGNISCTLPSIKNRSLSNIKLYSTYPIYSFLGEITPQQIGRHEKIVICDFDKTLVDTKYSNIKDIVKSLTKPIAQYPAVDSSIELLSNLIAKKYHPFIVSASPHFYELAIRRWLDTAKIPQCPITLKNYRDIFSLWHERLSFKDIKIHGNYKLHSILDILIMTGIPKNLVLIGDSSETDAEIYLLVKEILTSDSSAWELWQRLKDKKCFLLTARQSSQIIRKINLLKSKIKLAKGRGTKIDVQIFIRLIDKATDQTPSHEDIIYY